VGEVVKGEAKVKIKEGAVGIGETHDSANGRLLTLNLIRQNLVRHLFVEFAQETYGELVKKGWSVRESGYDRIFPHVNFWSQFQCTIPVGQVIARAIEKGVEVHCADSIWGNVGGHDWERNETVAATFESVVGHRNSHLQDAADCLILFGSAHFEGPQSITMKLNDLPWVNL
jgi:hypothetical protein